jgi:very-short-patch-repair endonuclease
LARTYRDQLTLPEALIWHLLRTRPFGLVFRKQYRFGRLQLDFYCAERALAVEIDGIAHDMGDRPERDPNRDMWLRSLGIETMRVLASEVLFNANDVADSIAQYALSLPVVYVAPRKHRRRDPSDPLRGPPPLQERED